MTERQLESIMIADALRHSARRRREDLELGLYKRPRPSRDNTAVYDGHKANTHRRFPRTSYTDAERLEGTSPNMRVIFADGHSEVVPAIPSWRSYLKRAAEITDATVETSRVEHGHDWES
jgi:hypothetical protein